MEKIATLVLRQTSYLKRGDVFACDSGALSVIEHHDDLKAVYGDFDSVTSKQASLIQAYAQSSVVYPIMKDKTDGELAIEAILKQGYTRLYVYGAFGDRIDHQHVLLVLALRYPELIYVSETQELQSYGKGEYTLQKDRYTSFSVFSYDKAMIELKDCVYPLEKISIDGSNTLTISNVWLSDEAKLKVYSGQVWVSKNV